jgi:gas vesicle protein
MAKNNNGFKFLEGAVAGIALGVAASLFLSSKTGKKITKEAGDYLADFYKHIAPKVKKMEKMGKQEYNEFMKNAVGQYSKIKKMPEEATKELIKNAQQSWEHFSHHLGK